MYVEGRFLWIRLEVNESWSFEREKQRSNLTNDFTNICIELSF